MTAKEKAKELRDKFQNTLFDKRHLDLYQEDAMECALIAVDEIISSLPAFPAYWKEVKQEIENP